MRLALMGLAFVGGTWVQVADGPAHAHSPAETLRADSGACLQPIEAASVTGPYETFLRRTLGLSDRALVVALVIKPSFRVPCVLSLRRVAGDRRLFRVTRLDPNVWRPSFERVQVLQAASAHIADDDQLRALAGVAMRSSTTEHEVDRRTADLFAEVWHALLRRTQPIHTNGYTIDGTRYDFWVGGRAGTVVSPSDGSVLEHATRAAEHLARVAEDPSRDRESALVEIQQDLKEALVRTRRKEPCIRTLAR